MIRHRVCLSVTDGYPSDKETFLMGQAVASMMMMLDLRHAASQRAAREDGLASFAVPRKLD